jgi:hypothetical protein
MASFTAAEAVDNGGIYGLSLVAQLAAGSAVGVIIAAG